MTAEDMRKVSGGVIGHLTPKEITIDIAKNPKLGTVGTHTIGLKVPAGKLLVGGYIKNLKNDLAGDATATVKAVAGATNLSTATVIGSVKGKAVGTLNETLAFLATATDVSITVGVKDITAGTLTVGVLYI